MFITPHNRKMLDRRTEDFISCYCYSLVSTSNCLESDAKRKAMDRYSYNVYMYIGLSPLEQIKFCTEIGSRAPTNDQ